MAEQEQLGSRLLDSVTYVLSALIIPPPTTARSAALVLHVDVALILLPLCRNYISFLRRTPFYDIIPFDKVLTTMTA